MSDKTSCLILLRLCLPVRRDSTLNGWFNDVADESISCGLPRLFAERIDDECYVRSSSYSLSNGWKATRDRLQSFHHGIFKRYLCRVRFNHKRESMRSQVVRRIATTLITLYSRTDFKVNSANPSLLEDLLGNVTFPWQYNYIYASLGNWGKRNRFILKIRILLIINFMKNLTLLLGYYVN